MLLYELFELDSDPDWLHPGGAECLSLPPCSPFLAWTSTGGAAAALGLQWGPPRAT